MDVGNVPRFTGRDECTGTGGENGRGSDWHEIRVLRKRHGAGRVWIVDGAVGKADRCRTVGRAVIIQEILVQNGPWFRRTIQVIGREVVAKPNFTRATLCQRRL